MEALALAGNRTQLFPTPNLAAIAESIAIKLADEGIPVRAIARAVSLASDKLYLVFREAVDAGTLTEMPRDDWPPGTNRGQRVVFTGSPFDDDQVLKRACARHFKATPLEAVMLTLLLKRNEVTKDQLHAVIEQNRPGSGSPHRDATDPKIVDVLICKLRKKLKKFNVTIDTMWGLGYLISVTDRDRAIAALTAASTNG